MPEWFRCVSCAQKGQRLTETESFSVLSNSGSLVADRIKLLCEKLGCITCTNANGLIYCHTVGVVECPLCSKAFHRQMDQCYCGYAPQVYSGKIWVIDSPDSSRLPQVEVEMSTLGAPTVRAFSSKNQIYALEGSQRLASAKKLGLTPRIMLVPDNYFLLWSDWGNPQLSARDWFEDRYTQGRWITEYTF